MFSVQLRVTPPHGYSHTQFWGDLPPLLDGACCFDKQPIKAEESPHITMQHISTLYCSLGVPAGVHVLRHTAQAKA